MGIDIQTLAFLALTMSWCTANTSSSSIRSTLSSVTSSSAPGSNPGADNAAASAAAAAAAGAPYLSLRGGRFADAGSAPGPPTGFNTALIGVYSGQPQLTSSPANAPLPVPPAYTAGNYPTPWGDYPNVYPAINGYQQPDNPGVNSYTYGFPPRRGVSVGPNPVRNPISLPAFGTNDRGTPPGTTYSTGASPGVSSYLVRSINGFATSSDLADGYGYGYPDSRYPDSRYPDSRRTGGHPLTDYLNEQPRQLPFPHYLYGQI